MASKKPSQPAIDSVQPGPVDDAESGKTKVQQDGDSAPKLPHERDQSSDSQETADGEPTRVGKQGHADLERGLVDTGTSPVTDKVYNEKVSKR
ncbi:hypothetical protein RCH10_000620 [Variovorax sp. GrIS 2.14]|uniref:hypothetical protein n=1 Tax=Variovorax sp. GrIS 2.14 TaxID=3071709 RepID=UPI0019B327D6|nr:hypothetical protein [Variovorax sp.]